MTLIIPHLWFDKEAVVAAEFYVSVFPVDAELMVIAYVRDGAPEAPGPFPALRVAPQSGRDGIAEPESHRLLSITVRGCPHHAQVPGVSVWNGTSWVLRRFARPAAGAAIVVHSLLVPRSTCAPRPGRSNGDLDAGKA